MLVVAPLPRHIVGSESGCLLVQVPSESPAPLSLPPPPVVPGPSDRDHPIAAVAVSCPNECSYHGRCVSMSRAAIDARHTNQLAYYEALWDKSMIFGCQCDVGWEGYDCSLRQVTTRTAQLGNCPPLVCLPLA